MFDFSNLDPETIAKFWIYCIGFLIVGLIIGWFARVTLTKIAMDNFRSEKKRFEAERASLMDIKSKYEDMCEDLEKNAEYWLYKKQESGPHDVVDPSELLHTGLKKKR
ncbi:MAG: hypothetical protein LBT26_01415 [Clostridiales Family XIII bacterium]|jgi:hypothetical protein|nr:hypothetical protein [Clostridiales Family XIII bacterium]